MNKIMLKGERDNQFRVLRQGKRLVILWDGECEMVYQQTPPPPAVAPPPQADNIVPLKRGE